jgi:hypothetical protein
MKKIIYNLLAALVLITSCRKSDNPVLPDNLQRAPIPQFTIDPNADQLIPGQDPDSFNGKFSLSQYFTTDHSYKSFDIVIRKNGDNGTIKVFQDNVTQLPADFTITGVQLKTLFNAAIEPTDFYDIGADAHLADGTKLEAFPSDGNPSYDPNIATFPNIGPTSIQYGVFCEYDASVYKGDFVVVQDDWQDYHAGDVVPVTQIDGTHFSFEYAAADAQPIIVEVDPVTNVTSVADQYFGNYGAAFGNFRLHSVSSANNNVLPCQGVFSVVVDIYSDNPNVGDQGNFRIVMQKK